MENPVQIRLTKKLKEDLWRRRQTTGIAMNRLMCLAVEAFLEDYSDAEMIDLDCRFKKSQLADSAES